MMEMIRFKGDKRLRDRFMVPEAYQMKLLDLFCGAGG